MNKFYKTAFISTLSVLMLTGAGVASACEQESVCGNTKVEQGEECDLGKNNGQYSTCSTTCKRQTVVEKIVEKIKEVPVEVIKHVEVIKEVPVEKIVEKEVKVIEKVEVVKEIPVEKIKEVEVVKEVPVETVKTVEVIKEVEKTLPKTGLPVLGILGMGIASTGIVLGSKKALKK